MSPQWPASVWTEDGISDTPVDGWTPLVVMNPDKLKAKIGRPLNQEFQRTKIRTVRLTDDDYKKLKALGTDRLRAWLRKAK